MNWKNKRFNLYDNFFAVFQTEFKLKYYDSSYEVWTCLFECAQINLEVSWK